MSKLNLAFLREEVKASVKNTALSNDRIDRWANIAQERVVNYINPKHLYEEHTFDTVADQRTYFVEIDPFKLLNVQDTSNEEFLVEVSEDYIKRLDPSLEDTGNPNCYSLTGLSEVIAQPAAATTLSIVSSSGSDIEQTVRILGKNSSGVYITEEVTLTGTSAVTTTQSFETVSGVRKSDYTEGYVTVTAGAVTIVVIPCEKNTQQYVVLNFYYMPSDAYTIRINYLRLPRELVEAEDIPDLPPNFHYLVLKGTLIEAHRNNYDFDIAEKLDADFLNEVEKYRKNQVASINQHRRIAAPNLVEGESINGRLPTYVTGD